MSLVVFLSVLAALFVLIGVGQPLAARLRLPYTVLLAVAGIGIGAAAGFLLRTDLTDALNPLALSILDLPINSVVILYVFLPTLLFQVALSLDLRRMADDWVPILVMAVLAVVVATFVIGGALYPFAGQSLVVCLLIGAIVATTDPSAVVSIFRDIGAPARLSRLIEGESLLNDAAAIALFGVFITMIIPWAGGQDLPVQVAELLAAVALGAVVGWTIARTSVWLMAQMRAHRLAQMSISVALPYLAYLISEQLLSVSGVIAVVMAGMTLNLTAPARLTPEHWKYLRETWELLAHWAGSLIFVLAALIVPRLLSDVTWLQIALILVVVVAAMIARAVILFGLLPALAWARVSPPVSQPYKLVILWGGLRGAVTLALALAVTENPAVPASARQMIAVVATGFVLFTLLVQGTTLRLMIRRTGLDQLQPIDAALQAQVIAVALQNVRESVAETAQRHQLTHDITRSEAKRFAARLDSAVTAAEEGAEILDRDRLTLGLVTLAGRERDMILDGMREGAISPALTERMMADVARLIERTRITGRSEYRKTVRANLAYGLRHKVAQWLYRVLRLSRPLERIVADRFEILLITRIILRDLHPFIDSKILRIHGRRVAELLHEILSRREEDIDRELQGLRLQYPDYAEEFERGFIRRAALRLEEREYRTALDDGLIGPELFTSLMRQLDLARRSASARPRLDLSRHRRALVSALPQFESLTEPERRSLARAFSTLFAAPGDVIIRKGQDVPSAFLIASGAVELDVGGQTRQLGAGEMFGGLHFLTGRKARRGQVRAMTYTTLLVLDETRLRRLMRREPGLQAAILRAVEETRSSPESARRDFRDWLAGKPATRG